MRQTVGPGQGEHMRGLGGTATTRPWLMRWQTWAVQRGGHGQGHVWGGRVRGQCGDGAKAGASASNIGETNVGVWQVLGTQLSAKEEEKKMR